MLDEYVKSYNDIESAKDNEEFNESLKNKEEEAREERDIVKLYDLLDTLLFIEADEARINEVYALVVELAMENLAQKIEAQEKFELSKEHDHYTARALYEHAIEKYSNDDKSGAKELFLMLSVLNDSAEFKGAMQIHMVAVATGVNFNKFMRLFVDHDAVEKDEGASFIMHFYDYAGEYLQKHKEVVQEAILSVGKIVSK